MTAVRRHLVGLLCALGVVPGALAHEVRPAYLELRQSGRETYDVLWKVPARGESLRLSLAVRFPAECTDLSEPRAALLNAASIERWRVQCPGGLDGRVIRIAGLAGTASDVLVRLQRLDGTVQIARLTPVASSFLVEAVPNPLRVATTYLQLGIEHILGGIDHLLFVLALLLLVKGTRQLVTTITAFTLAHSVTLAAATLGVVNVPQGPAEAVIALSIAFVAAESARRRTDAGQERNLVRAPARAPWVMACSFGLLHGFGFAGALAEVGLPRTAVPVALLFFNLGVEIGQLLFIAAIIVSIALARHALDHFPPWRRVSRFAALFRLVPPYAIGGLAAFWVFERVAAF